MTVIVYAVCSVLKGKEHAASRARGKESHSLHERPREGCRAEFVSNWSVITKRGGVAKYRDRRIGQRETEFKRGVIGRKWTARSARGREDTGNRVENHSGKSW